VAVRTAMAELRRLRAAEGACGGGGGRHPSACRRAHSTARREARASALRRARLLPGPPSSSEALRCRRSCSWPQGGGED
jgi:hypothetical protein